MAREQLVHHPLRNGWVALERETTADGALLHFAVELNTNFPAAVVFEQVVLGLIDSDKSWLWPKTYENNPEPLGRGVRAGDTIKMTYRVPRFDRPEIPAKPVTYSYLIPRYSAAEMLLEYQSVDHPLPGGAILRAIPLGPDKSRLSWVGAYQQRPSQTVVVESIIKYFPFLYSKFEDNLEARERGAPQAC